MGRIAPPRRKGVVDLFPVDKGQAVEPADKYREEVEDRGEQEEVASGVVEAHRV